MNPSNNYQGEVCDIINNSENPPIYFVNVQNTEGTSEPNSHIWNSKNLDTAKNTILRTIERDDILQNKGVAKFIITFPFGFVAYSWGNNTGTDFNLMKQGEWVFDDNYDKVESKDNLPDFCGLELDVIAQEKKLWYSVKSISDYYTASREKLSTRLEKADKTFY